MIDDTKRLHHRQIPRDCPRHVCCGMLRHVEATARACLKNQHSSSETKDHLQMFRTLTAIAILLSSSAPLFSADDGDRAVCNFCHAESTTLRLYFQFATAGANRMPSEFKPEIAKVYVDDLYVGDAIVNLHGHVPTLRFPKSTVKLRVEMSEKRRFETKITFLGHGSTQVLYIDFGKSAPETAARRGG